MKKVLAAVIVLAASSLASPVFAAHEMADIEKPSPTGALQVYGAAKMSIDLIDTGSKASGADTSLAKISSNSSRVGFKGSEDLGDGLATVYQLELSVDMDKELKTGLRNSYVGLKGGFGTALLGIHDTPYKSATGQFDVFGDSMGDYNAIIGNVNGSSNFELRPSNVAAYVSPDFGGFQLSAATIASETTNTTSGDPSAYSVAATYKTGGLALALAHEIHKNGAATWDAGTTMTGTRLGAGYTFGGTKIGFVFETLSNDESDSEFSRDALYLSVAQKIGKETIKLAYGIADDGESAEKTGATFLAVGLDHAFSKRTTAYVLYAATDNDDDATYGLGQGGAGGAYKPGAGEDPSVLSFGINYTF